MIARIRSFYAEIPVGLRGMLIMLFSTLSAVTMHAAVKELGKDIHAFEIAFFRNAMMVFFLLPLAIPHGVAVLKTNRLGWHLVRSLLGTCSMMAFFYGLTVVPLAQATALGFTAPLFASLLAIVFLGEVVRLRRWTAIIVGFFGTVVIVEPWGQELDIGAIWVIVSAALWGFAIVIIRFMGRTDSSLTTTIYMMIFMSPLSLLPALFVWTWPTWEQFAWLGLAAAAGTLTQLGIAQALRMGDTSVIMPMDFCRMLWATLMGMLFFAEWPTVYTWLGAVMIFASTTYIAYREDKVRRYNLRLAAQREAERPAGPKVTEAKGTESKAGETKAEETEK